MLPFFFVHETGLFQTGVMLALLWELIEWVTYTVMGNYGPLFNFASKYESPYNIWVLDVGGAAIGTLLIMSCTYVSSRSDRLSSFWQPFRPSPTVRLWVRLLRFLAVALLVSFLADFGWKCGFVESWCSEGYHAFPWGTPIIIAVLAGYAYASSAPPATYGVIAALYVPTFIPNTADLKPWSASFVNLVTVWPVAVVFFAVCVVHRYNRRNKPRYTRIINTPSA